MVELIVVLAVTVILTSLLLPAMSQLQETAFRIVCSSNERQLGQGIFMYAHDHLDQLPKSSALTGEHKRPQELMSAYNPKTHEWDGWGELYMYQYCGAVECYYCPSHRGEHPIERYYQSWNIQHKGSEPIYTNYHYSGHVEWDTGNKRNLHSNSSQALATDGLRTASDFNHKTGMNILYADGSVRWSEDTEDVLNLLPKTAALSEDEAEQYNKLWSVVEIQR